MFSICKVQDTPPPPTRELSSTRCQYVWGWEACFTFFFFWPYGLWDISSPVKDWTQAPAMKALSPSKNFLSSLVYFFSLQSTIGILGEACLLDQPSREPRTSLSATWGSPLDPDWALPHRPRPGLAPQEILVHEDGLVLTQFLAGGSFLVPSSQFLPCVWVASGFLVLYWTAPWDMRRM